MTVTEVALKLGKTEETVRRYIRTGKLKAVMSSKKEGYFIEKEDIQDLLLKKHHKSFNTLEEQLICELKWAEEACKKNNNDFNRGMLCAYRSLMTIVYREKELLD